MDLKDKDLITPNQEDLSNEDVVSFYNSFDSLLKIIENNSTLTKDLSSMIKSGKKTIYNKQIKETKEFETAFLDTLEAAYPAFSKIAKNPKSSIKYEEDIVGVEKARKINGATVKHLSSHSELVREVKNDNVIPSKILTTYAEEDLAIYENRVYKTLVNNIVRFLTRRAGQLEDAIEASQIDEIDYNNILELSEQDKVEFGLTIKVKKGLNKENNVQNDILRRTENLLTAYKSLKATPFMKGLKDAKDVHPPLMKTNIILHNADFKIVYNTWIFMERYSSVTYNVGVHDTDFSSDPRIEHKLDSLALVLMNTLMYHRDLNIEGLENKDSLAPELVHEKSVHSIDMKAGVLEGDEYTFSEIFLDEARKLIDSDYKANLAKGVAKEISMREAIRKMLKITNQMCPVTFEYKDDDLDEIGKDIDVLIEEASDRYCGLKILREEKEIDLNKNIKAEEEALKHLEELKKRKDIQNSQKEFDYIRETEEARKREENELENARKLAFMHQEELRLKREEELKKLALEKESNKKESALKSRTHEVKQKHSRKRIRIFDLACDPILDLYNNEPTNTLKSRREYEITLRQSNEEICEKIKSEKTLDNTSEIALEDELDTLDNTVEIVPDICEPTLGDTTLDNTPKITTSEVQKAFKRQEKDYHKARNERVKLDIKYEESKLIPTNESLSLFVVPRRLDIDTISNQYKKVEPIIIKPSKFNRLIGMKKTKVNSKTLSKEEIDSLDTRKIIGKNRTLVQKKTKGKYEKNN